MDFIHRYHREPRTEKEREDLYGRIRKIAYWLDSFATVGGMNVGLEAIVGFIPVIGTSFTSFNYFSWSSCSGTSSTGFMSSFASRVPSLVYVCAPSVQLSVDRLICMCLVKHRRHNNINYCSYHQLRLRVLA